MRPATESVDIWLPEEAALAYRSPLQVRSDGSGQGSCFGSNGAWLTLQRGWGYLRGWTTTHHHLQPCPPLEQTPLWHRRLCGMRTNLRSNGAGTAGWSLTEAPHQPPDQATLILEGDGSRTQCRTRRELSGYTPACLRHKAVCLRRSEQARSAWRLSCTSARSPALSPQLVSVVGSGRQLSTWCCTAHVSPGSVRHYARPPRLTSGI